MVCIGCNQIFASMRHTLESDWFVSVSSVAPIHQQKPFFAQSKKRTLIQLVWTNWYWTEQAGIWSSGMKVWTQSPAMFVSSIGKPQQPSWSPPLNLHGAWTIGMFSSMTSIGMNGKSCAWLLQWTWCSDVDSDELRLSARNWRQLALWISVKFMHCCKAAIFLLKWNNLMLSLLKYAIFLYPERGHKWGDCFC